MAAPTPRPLRFAKPASVLLAVALLAGAASSARANVPFKQISTTGPLQGIWIGNELSCQVKHVDDGVFSFYPSNTAPGDCGAILWTPAGGVVSPNWSAHNVSAADGTPAEGADFVPVSQVGPTGTGTAADPFKIVTTVGQPPGTNEDRVIRTDTYVAGSSVWNTTLTVTDIGVAPADQDTTVLYHAADCYLAESDIGFGAVDLASGSAYCTGTANNSPPGRVVGFEPTPPASVTGGRVLEGHYRTDVWNSVTGAPFPNLCAKCTVSLDNGAGLSWSFVVPANGSVTVGFSTKVLTPPPKCGKKSVTIAGTDDAETIAGTPKDDVIFGGAGNDTIVSGAGKDAVCGGDGDDILEGEAAKDRLRGEEGNDEIRGGPGADRGLGGPGDDKIFGQGGRDKLKGNSGEDFLHGGGAGDQLSGGGGSDSIQTAGDFDDKVSCGGGRDRAKADNDDRVSGNCERVRGRKGDK